MVTLLRDRSPIEGISNVDVEFEVRLDPKGKCRFGIEVRRNGIEVGGVDLVLDPDDDWRREWERRKGEKGKEKQRVRR